MIFNMVGGRTGTGALNFNIVGGTTEPTNPSENTIWVNTSEEITGWELSSANSNTLATGGVWIQTGSITNINFNALKENVLMVYPLKAQQLISDVWTGMPTMIYQNGAWAEWATYLFINGNECSDTTGGWCDDGNTRVDEDATSLHFDNADNSGYATSGRRCTTYTANAIDLTLFGSLVVTATSAGRHEFSIWVQNDAEEVLATLTMEDDDTIGCVIAEETDVTLDLTNVNEACHIYIEAYGHDSGNAGSGTSYAHGYFNVTEVKLV